MPITTTTVLAAQVQQSFNMKLLSTPTAQYIHKVPAELMKIPRNGGDTLRMTRYNQLPSSLVPLGNTGVTPPSTQLTAVNIDAQINYYGQYIEINEQVTLQRKDPVLNAASERLGDAMRRTEDELTRNMLAGTAAFLNCVGGVNGDNPTELSRTDIDEAVQTLLGADARTFLDKIPGENRFGTAPVRNAYFALAHTAITSSLADVAGFIHSSQYPNPNGPIDAEWGSVANLRFLVSSIGSVTAASSLLGANVYNIFCVGMEALGCIEQDGYSAQFIYNGPELNGPLRLNSTAGYKFAEVPRILNDAWIINLRCTL